MDWFNEDRIPAGWENWNGCEDDDDGGKDRLVHFNELMDDESDVQLHDIVRDDDKVDAIKDLLQRGLVNSLLEDLAAAFDRHGKSAQVVVCWSKDWDLGIHGPIYTLWHYFFENDYDPALLEKHRLYARAGIIPEDGRDGEMIGFVVRRRLLDDDESTSVVEYEALKQAFVTNGKQTPFVFAHSSRGTCVGDVCVCPNTVFVASTLRKPPIQRDCHILSCQAPTVVFEIARKNHYHHHHTSSAIHQTMDLVQCLAKL